MDRRELRHRLFEHAAYQAGHFTAAEAKQVGYSYAAQAYHVDVGNWERVGRGLFRLREWVPDLHEDLVRWTLWSKKRAVVSHASALSVHEIGEFEAPRVNMTVPPGFRMRHEALALHRQHLATEDIVEHAGFRLTSVTRSLIDVACQLADEDQLARAINEALEAGKATRRRLRSRSEAVDPRASLYIERALGRLGA